MPFPSPFPAAVARPLRLTGLAILIAILLALLSPAASVSHAAAGAAASATPTPDRSWSWPLAPPHPVMRPFIAPEDRYSAGHRGIDVGSSPGQEIRSPNDGVVYFVGFVVDRPVLSIRHAGGLVSSYEPVVSALSAGDPVLRGQVVGTLLAGHCASGCLHFGVRLHGEYVSPLIYLGGVARSILLPTRGLP